MDGAESVSMLWRSCGKRVGGMYGWVAIWTLSGFVVCIVLVYCDVCVGNKMLRYD